MKNLFNFFCLSIASVLCTLPLLAEVLTVGKDKTYADLTSAYKAANNGDTIEIYPGIYSGVENTLTINKNLILRGVGKRPVLDMSGLTIPNNKGILIASSDDITIENLEITGAHVKSDNGSGIRVQGAKLTIRNCVFHHNEDGIQGGLPKTELLVENCDFYENGFGDGYTHNVYVGKIAKLTFRFNRSRRCKEGHLFKSRAQENYILYNFFATEDATSSYEINLPQGGVAYIIGNLIQQGTLSKNDVIIAYAEEKPRNDAHALYIINNTIVNDHKKGVFVRVREPSAECLIMNNIFVGPGKLLDGAGTLENNLNLSASDLVNATAFNYHLTPLSSAVDGAKDPGNASGFSLIPTHEYVDPCSGKARHIVGKLDVGAFELAQPAAK
jgi:hypothetical protein